MPLSDTACKNAHKNEKASSGKPFKLSDEKGLFLLVKPQEDGWGKWWRFKYRFDGKEKMISPSRQGRFHPCPSQTRTCGITASGSSHYELARSGIIVHDLRPRQR